MKTKYIAITLIVLAVFASCKKDTDLIKHNVPTVTTKTVDNITALSAVCGGNVTKDGYYEVTERGVCWGNKSNPTIADNKTIDSLGLGSFTSKLTNLKPGTKYFVRAYAINQKGVGYGNEVTFSTYSGDGSVYTSEVTDITSNTARCGGTITDDGGYVITERGVCWNTSMDMTIQGNHTSDGSGTGSFTSELTGLKSNTQYYVCAYATNSIGTTYGNIMSFKTAEATEHLVTPSDVSCITNNTAICGGTVTGDGGFAVTARGVCWSTGPNPTTADPHTADGTGAGTFTSEITGLSPNTLYYVRAYSTNEEGTVYSDRKAFVTASGVNNGHAFVDLGLTSNTLWATSNIGASRIEDYGAYYAWGETSPKDNYSWGTYLWSNGSENTLTKYCTNAAYGYYGFVDNKTILEPDDDVAHATWGGSWNMPTTDMFNELLTECTSTWINQNGVNGRQFTGPNGNSIFLPAAGYYNGSSLYLAGSHGYYWSSSLLASNPNNAYLLFFGSGGVGMDNYGRYDGQSVRPVITMDEIIVTTIAVTDITATTATCEGHVIDMGGMGVTERGICWSKTENPTVEDSHKQSGSGTGSFTVNVENLDIDETYHVRAYAKNSCTVNYGNDVSFTTLDGKPVVTTLDVTEIMETTAICGGCITEDYGFAVTERGICWSTTPDPTTSDNCNTEGGQGTGTYYLDMTGLAGNTTYYVRSYAKNDNGIGYGEQKSFRTTDSFNGHAFVDLGLPSGTLWATCNVGANNPEENGSYYAWGETIPKSYYNWGNYQWCNGSQNTLTKYCTDPNHGIVDNKTVLELEDDAAHVNWNGSWRIPTYDELDELKTKCTWTWTTQGGKCGYRVTSSNGKSIFLPAAGIYYGSVNSWINGAGCYWICLYDTNNNDVGCCLDFHSNYVNHSGTSRCYGLTIRPVCPPQK